MKKKLFLGFAALGMLFSACQKQELSQVGGEETNLVTVGVELPAEFTHTRALPTAPDGHKLRCVLVVMNGESNVELRKEILPAEGTQFSFELANQGDYTAFLWADYIDIDAEAGAVTELYADKYYNTANMLNVYRQQHEAATLPEVTDAFYARVDFNKGVGAKALTATLTRAVSKITIAEKNETVLGYISNVKAEYTVPLSFNLESGSVNAGQTMDVEYDAAPNGTDITINGAPCKTLFYDYVLSGANGSMGPIYLTFTPIAGSPITAEELKIIPAGIPSKQNHQINAAGRLITEPSNDVTMDFDISSDWTGTDDEEAL